MYNLDDAVLEKHSVTVAGHRTSISLERGFWRRLRALARKKDLSVNELIRQLDEARAGSLSGALRSYVLEQTSKQTLD
jgi:predicted DNA-binding ribbon-helix-helix protein